MLEIKFDKSCVTEIIYYVSDVFKLWFCCQGNCCVPRLQDDFKRK